MDERPIIAAVSKELLPIAISGTPFGMVNLFQFIGAAVFQVLIGAVLTAGSYGQAEYSTESFRYMFLICTTGAALSLAIAFFLKETLSVEEDS